MKIAAATQLNYSGDDNGASFYTLTVKDADGVYQTAATVVVDQSTRAIKIATPDATREIPTNGLASLTFEGDTPRVSGLSVAQYVGPRVGMLLARLYAPAFAA